jgi:hypothetical protein
MAFAASKKGQLLGKLPLDASERIACVLILQNENNLHPHSIFLNLVVFYRNPLLQDAHAGNPPEGL